MRYSESGFSLVELMVVVAIVAVLSSVAIPAYINHVNRARQSEALTALMNAKMEQEVFWGENDRYRYAGTVGCLPAFGNNCLQPAFTVGGYVISVQNANTSTFTMLAQKKIYSYAATDTLRISSTLAAPQVVNTSALSFSIFNWLFD